MDGRPHSVSSLERTRWNLDLDEERYVGRVLSRTGMEVRMDRRTCRL